MWPQRDRNARIPPPRKKGQRRKLTYEEIKEQVDGKNRPNNPGIQVHKFPTYEDRKAHFSHLPALNLRFAFIGTSGSGKGIAMQDMLLRHYRGVFDRVYAYCKSASIDRAWDPVKRYVAEVQGVAQDEEKTFFD
jgi:hypothetical protein